MDPLLLLCENQSMADFGGPAEITTWMVGQL
jgi:hypothetical protein